MFMVIYCKIQILTIEDLISGNKNIERPPKVAINDITFKKAKKHIYNKGEQGELKLEWDKLKTIKKAFLVLYMKIITLINQKGRGGKTTSK